MQVFTRGPKHKGHFGTPADTGYARVHAHVPLCSIQQDAGDLAINTGSSILHQSIGKTALGFWMLNGHLSKYDICHPMLVSPKGGIWIGGLRIRSPD